VLEQRLGERVGEAVEDNAAVLAGLHEPGGAQHAQPVTGSVLRDPERQRQIADAELLDEVERVQQADTYGIAEEGEEARQSLSVVGIEDARLGSAHTGGIDGMLVVSPEGHIRTLARMCGYLGESVPDQIAAAPILVFVDVAAG
jgi:hypothetical protein